jgi:hypothetical protein
MHFSKLLEKCTVSHARFYTWIMYCYPVGYTHKAWLGWSCVILIINHKNANNLFIPELGNSWLLPGIIAFLKPYFFAWLGGHRDFTSSSNTGCPHVSTVNVRWHYYQNKQRQQPDPHGTYREQPTRSMSSNDASLTMFPTEPVRLITSWRQSGERSRWTPSSSRWSRRSARS